MDLNNINSFFSLIMLVCGGYCLVMGCRFRSGKVPEKFALLHKDFPMEKCLDPEYYVMYMRPRLLVFGVLMVLLGGFSLLDSQLGLVAALTAGMSQSVQMAVNLAVQSILPFGAVAWFAACLMKIQKELW